MGQFVFKSNTLIDHLGHGFVHATSPQNIAKSIAISGVGMIGGAIVGGALSDNSAGGIVGGALVGDLATTSAIIMHNANKVSKLM